MKTIIATTPAAQSPSWAVWQRRLIDEMSAAVHPFLAKYTREDGSVIWRDDWNNGRDGVDDFYEGFYNWPLLYLIGGADELLPLAQRQWDALTRQLTALGPVHREYERGYDQFHQSEHYTYFYFLCLADPGHAANRERALRFARMYTGEDPDAPNYDPAHKLIRAPHNGSGGPRWGFFDDAERAWGYAEWMKPYGLPFDDVPGVRTLEDLKDPGAARKMGAALHERYGRGDVAANLGVVSLVANAFLLTGDARCRDWVLEYTGAWLARARAHDGLIPDNVGLSGQVGEYLGGKWYGGLYGWQWPHGYYNLGMATIVAATAAYLVSRDEAYLELPRSVMDRVWSLRKRVPAADVLKSSLGHHWLGQLTAAAGAEMVVVPYRHGDHGWFDYQPMSPIYPAALWALTQSDEDWDRVERIRREEPFSWNSVVGFRNKEDSGHEQPWLRFVAGDNPGYPEAILASTLAQVSRRVALMRQDRADLARVNIHHWQQLNPVTCEALVQLTLGAPAPIYNGGLLIAPLRYFDADRGRPGLPRDVAALVERVTASSVTVRLVNVSALDAHRVTLQAGAFGEHRFDQVAFDARLSEYPGAQTAYAAPPLQVERRSEPVGAQQFEVVLPPGHEIRLEIGMTRYAH